MTGEEMDRAIEFLLKSQAQLSAKVDRTADGVTALLAIAELQAQEIKDLGESVREVSESVREVNAAVREIGESVRTIDERQRHTDERLSALINVVDRIVGDRNGA
jgi:uncharacterized protein YoxC